MLEYKIKLFLQSQPFLIASFMKKTYKTIVAQQLAYRRIDECILFDKAEIDASESVVQTKEQMIFVEQIFLVQFF